VRLRRRSCFASRARPDAGAVAPGLRSCRSSATWRHCHSRTATRASESHLSTPIVQLRQHSHIHVATSTLISKCALRPRPLVQVYCLHQSLEGGVRSSWPRDTLPLPSNLPASRGIVPPRMAPAAAPAQCMLEIGLMTAGYDPPAGHPPHVEGRSPRPTLLLTNLSNGRSSLKYHRTSPPGV
jgi:hypothetical protein